MITRTELPSNYIQYQKLTVCSNLLIGGGFIIVIGNIVPILVGKGDNPLVWLQAPLDKNGKFYVPVVMASVAAHPAVSIMMDDKGLSVYVSKTLVLHIIQNEVDSATIDVLDLRPLGFDVYGDSDALKAGGMTLSRNTFHGVGTLISFGSDGVTSS